MIFMKNIAGRLKLGMSISIFMTLILLIQLDVISQDITWKVKYAIAIVNPDPKHFPDSLFNMMYSDGLVSEEVHYFKGKYHKSIKQTERTNMVKLYAPAEDRMYTFIEGSDIGYYEEFNQSITIDRISNTDTILGYACNAVELKKENGKEIFYYSPEFLIKTKMKGARCQWQRVIQLTHSVPLKYSFEQVGAPFNIVMSATEITREELDDSFFKLPEFSQQIKMNSFFPFQQ
jgi:hypothetical protein